VLAEFVYLGNGAHWAIGALSAILFIDNSISVPEVVTGLLGVAIIAAAVVASIIHRRNRGDGDPEQPPAISGPSGELVSTATPASRTT